MRQHLLGQLACLGRHTLTGVAATAGGAFSDWSAHYRLYSRERFDPGAVFAVARRQIEERLDPDRPMIVAMDDSLLRKTGPKIHGVSYRRDPLGPPFHLNLVRGQRVLQLSAALPGPTPAGMRMVPLAFSHVPTPAKPSRQAGEDRWTEYRRARELSRISLHGLESVARLRRQMDADGEVERPLWVVVDGRFTNRAVMKHLPERTLFIGRIRGDAKLFHLPGVGPQTTGRRRIYGLPAPTPEQLRQSDPVPWRVVTAWACGRPHQFRVKTLGPLRWRPTSDQVDVRIVVVAPLGYRPSKHSRVLYRQPSYLVCTDPELPLDQLLQAYLWRWDVEVNFRDEKTLLGVGQAQVRNPASTESVPALAVAAYSLLLLAADQSFPVSGGPPPPKWRRSQSSRRPSLSDLVALLRHELWSDSIRSPRFSHFTSTPTPYGKSSKPLPSLRQALFYAPA